MGAFQRWLDGRGAACCPDPEEFDEHDLARFEDDGGNIRYDDEAITAHGYDSRTTPVDTLMAGPVSMHLSHGDNMIHGDYA